MGYFLLLYALNKYLLGEKRKRNKYIFYAVILIQAKMDVSRTKMAFYFQITGTDQGKNQDLEINK